MFNYCKQLKPIKKDFKIHIFFFCARSVNAELKYPKVNFIFMTLILFPHFSKHDDSLLLYTYIFNSIANTSKLASFS